VIADFSDFFYFFFIALAAEILGTLGGFGSSLFFVSIAQFFFDMQTVLAFTGLLHIFSNTSKIFLFWRHIDWKLTLRIGIPSIVFTIGGALLATQVSLEYARLILGFFLILFSGWLFFKPDFKLEPRLQNSLLGGSLAGFLAGFVGTGGAIRGLVLASIQLEKSLLIGTSAAIDFGVDFSRTLIYLGHGFLPSTKIMYIPLLLLASIAGSYLGKRYVERISQQTFKTILLTLIAVMGAILIAGHFGWVR